MPDVVTLNIPPIVALPSAGVLVWLIALVWRASTTWARTEKEVAQHAEKIGKIEKYGSVPVQVYIAEDREWKRNLGLWQIEIVKRMDKHSEGVDAMRDTMRAIAREGE